MNIVLLTHARELDKTTNTGCLVLDVLAERCELVVWKRKEPDEALIELFEQKKAVLLFPLNELPLVNLSLDDGKSSSSIIASAHSNWLYRYTHFVILDATWQQAKKMYRQSSYLQKADKIALDQAPVSRFQRRRNQRDGGLCTAECVIELLKSAEDELHTKLEYSFSSFNGLAAGRALT